MSYPKLLHEGHQLYNVELYITDKNDKYFDSKETGKITRFQFMQEYRDYEQMEWSFRRWARELKVIMPENTIELSAFLPNSISDTWMEMATYREKENRFITF